MLKRLSGHKITITHDGKPALTALVEILDQDAGGVNNGVSEWDSAFGVRGFGVRDLPECYFAGG
jgi:hypothetical protein